jgi:hypothetical protein
MNMSFTPPSISANTELTFSVTVHDGTASVSTSQTVSITNEALPTVTVDRKSSRGSMGWLALLLVPLAYLRRRQNKQ